MFAKVVNSNASLELASQGLGAKECHNSPNSHLSLSSNKLFRIRLSRDFFFFNDTATTEIYTLSLHDALPISEIVKGLVAKKKFVSLCTNALLLEKKLHMFEPSPYLFFSVHLDGLREHHDKSVCQEGVFDRAISAIKAAKAKGFTVNVNATIFDGHPPEDIAAFLDYAEQLGVGVSISPGYAYERAPDQEHFLSRRKTKELFRKVFSLGKGKKWRFMHSSLYLDFLTGNQTYHCTPWGMPTRNIFGWQKPCYLLGEGYAKTFRELMDTTDWDSYGTGRYEKCANCMDHCGYEPTAAEATISQPWAALKVAMFGPRTAGPMAPEIPPERQRPAEVVFSRPLAH